MRLLGLSDHIQKNFHLSRKNNSKTKLKIEVLLKDDILMIHLYFLKFLRNDCILKEVFFYD